MYNEVGTSEGFCAHTASIFQLLGTLLIVFKIIIPILLIIFGMLDLGKAVVATDDKQIKESVSRFAKRCVVSVFIFFLPTIVGAIFGLIQNFRLTKDDYEVCRKCIVSPNGSNENQTGCQDYIAKYE
jgi:fumarate reductase subunit D